MLKSGACASCLTRKPRVVKRSAAGTSTRRSTAHNVAQIDRISRLLHFKEAKPRRDFRDAPCAPLHVTGASRTVLSRETYEKSAEHFFQGKHRVCFFLY